MSQLASSDPFQVLGVPPDAPEEVVRARYLELVRQFSPDREPDKFREIRAAYEAAKDPLSIAARLVKPPEDGFSSWADVLKKQQQNPPRLSPAFVLSLGNRSGDQPETV